MKYSVEQVVKDLGRVGVRFARVGKEADASFLKVVGIGTLGKLDFLWGQGYSVILPVVEKRPSHGYKGLSRP